jgi:pyridoxamine 5'-phosphate oxidase
MNPRAALVIYWRELDRQVRVRGAVERLSAEASDEYFRSRPHGSQAAAAVSPQSRPVERDELDRRFEKLLAGSREGEIERPQHWGGYLVRPDEVEFWQGRENRMHDRFKYGREGTSWTIQRLAP